MALSDVGQSIKNDAQGLIGNIAKAVLVFPDTVPSEIDLKDPDATMDFGASIGMGRVSTYLKTTKMKKAGISQISKAAANVSSVTHALDQVGADTKSLTDAIGSTISGKKFTVQFNPSSLQIIARGGGRAPVSNYGTIGTNQAGKIEYRALDPYVTVSFTLLFDATNNADAFMEERFTIGATSLAKNVATAVVGNEYTVRPQVEGFLAALRDEDHRTMIFQWGTLRYTGMLNAVSGRYTMFNTAGNPIRAEVQVSMLMGSAPKNSMDGASYLDYWKKRYKDILEANAKKDADGNLTSMTTGNLKSQYSNLINL